MTEDKLKVEKTTGEEFTLHKTRSVSVVLFAQLIVQSTFSTNEQLKYELRFG